MGVLVFFWYGFAVGKSVSTIVVGASSASGVCISSSQTLKVLFVAEIINQDTAVDLERYVSIAGRSRG